jgi:hypothetical protein
MHRKFFEFPDFASSALAAQSGGETLREATQMVQMTRALEAAMLTDLPTNLLAPLGRRTQIPVLVLSDDISDRVTVKAVAIRRRFGAPVTADEQVREAALLAEAVDRIEPAIAPFLRLHMAPWAIGAAMVTNMPMERTVAAMMSLAIPILLGHLPFNYKTQNGGDLVMTLEPKEGAPKNTNATAGDFDYHNDDVFLPSETRVRWLGLYGVQNPPYALTAYVPIAAVWDIMDHHTVSVLCQPRFSVRMPPSFELGDDIWSGPRPIFYLRGDGERCVAIPTYAVRAIDAQDIDAANAIKRLRVMLDNFAGWAALEPGNYLMLDNDRGLHKRTRIKGDRLIYRTYSRSNLNYLRKISGNNGYTFDLKKIIKSV